MALIAMSEQSNSMSGSKHLAAFPDLFMDALVAVTQCFFDSIKQLPFSL